MAETNGKILAEISGTMTALQLGQETISKNQEVLTLKVEEINIKLFDHVNGIAIKVHDNTQLRQEIEKDKIIDKVYSSHRFVRSWKKHVIKIWISILLMVVSYSLKEFLF